MSPWRWRVCALVAALYGFALIEWLVQMRCANMCAPLAPDIEPTGCYCEPTRVAP